MLFWEDSLIIDLSDGSHHSDYAQVFFLQCSRAQFSNLNTETPHFHIGLGSTAVRGSFMAAQSSGFSIKTTSSILLLHEHKDGEHYAHCWISPQSLI